MCMSKPKAPPPIAMAPQVLPEVVDQVAAEERNRIRRRAATMGGRSSTILAGAAATPPTGQSKTLLGA